MASKSGGSVSSEGYSYLVQERLRELNRTFGAYVRSRDEMRCYVQPTDWKAKYYTNNYPFSPGLDMAARDLSDRSQPLLTIFFLTTLESISNLSSFRNGRVCKFPVKFETQGDFSPV
jgi:hypothetical protein